MGKFKCKAERNEPAPLSRQCAAVVCDALWRRDADAALGRLVGAPLSPTVARLLALRLRWRRTWIKRHAPALGAEMCEKVAGYVRWELFQDALANESDWRDCDIDVWVASQVWQAALDKDTKRCGIDARVVWRLACMYPAKVDAAQSHEHLLELIGHVSMQMGRLTLALIGPDFDCIASLRHYDNRQRYYERTNDMVGSELIGGYPCSNLSTFWWCLGAPFWHAELFRGARDADRFLLDHHIFANLANPSTSLLVSVLNECAASDLDDCMQLVWARLVTERPQRAYLRQLETREMLLQQGFWAKRALQIALASGSARCARRMFDTYCRYAGERGGGRADAAAADSEPVARAAVQPAVQQSWSMVLEGGVPQLCADDRCGPLLAAVLAVCQPWQRLHLLRSDSVRISGESGCFVIGALLLKEANRLDMLEYVANAFAKAYTCGRSLLAYRRVPTGGEDSPAYIAFTAVLQEHGYVQQCGAIRTFTLDNRSFANVMRSLR